MTVKVTVGKSNIHGQGVFAAENIHKGQVVWMFTPGLDQVFSDFSVKWGEPRMRAFIHERAYLSPHEPQWILPCDEAQYWNFPQRGEEANTYMGDKQDDEQMVIAARDITAGEELTIPPESDADYERKISQRENQG